MMPSAVTLANATAYADAMGDAIIDASDGQMMGYSINQSSNATGATPAVSGSRVEDKGVLSIQTAAGKDVQVTIPAVKLGVLQPNEYDLDLTDPIITAISTLLITGDGTVAPVDSNASDLAQVLRGFLRQRRGFQR
jgi:hypothetical protein